MRHPYTQGLFNSIPLPGADKNSRPLLSIPGQLPLPHQRPYGCNFGPRCPHFDEQKCNSAPVKMNPVSGDENHRSRCTRISEVDWNAEPERPVVADPVEPGKVVLKVDGLKKYYDVAANALFGGAETRTVKANESVSFTAREAETVAPIQLPPFKWFSKTRLIPSIQANRLAVRSCELSRCSRLATVRKSAVSGCWNCSTL